MERYKDRWKRGIIEKLESQIQRIKYRQKDKYKTTLKDRKKDSDKDRKIDGKIDGKKDRWINRDKLQINGQK